MVVDPVGLNEIVGREPGGVSTTRATRRRLPMRRLALAVVLTPLLLATGPCGPIPGTRIDGESAAETPSDWSFTDQISTIQVETRPEDPYSVTTWCVADGATLYVPSRGAEGKQWVKNVRQDPRIRLRVGDAVYTMRAVRVDDADEQRRVVELLRAKYRMARWGMDANPAKSPDTWYFRMEPRAGTGPDPDAG